jgi:Flp pilus assembly protein TadD
MKYYYSFLPALIGVSMVLQQPQVAVALSQQEVETIAKQITVQIVDNQNPSIAGSGVIIKQAGNIYTAITAYHVVKAGKKNIIMPDNQSYQIRNIKPLKGSDLAVVELSSSKSYKIAKIGNSDKSTASTIVYVAGFPARTAAISNPSFFFNKGQVNANGSAQRDGYNFIYDNDTLKGMSGGAILNEQGELVGIHGRADEQEIGEKSLSRVITGLGITIYSALRQLQAVGIDVGVKPPTLVAAVPKADDFFIRAKQKSSQKNYQSAIEDYTEAIRLNPNYYQAYNNRGSARENLGDKKGAIIDFNSALKINPNYATGYYNRGVARLNLGDNDEVAMTDFNQALKINPNYAQAYVNRGIAHRRLGNPNKAIADHNQALKINPNFAYAYANRGISRFDLGDKQEAIADLQKAADLFQQQGNTELSQDMLARIRQNQ